VVHIGALYGLLWSADEENRRRRQVRQHAGEEKQGKPLTEKVKEMVGAR
jgi:hypothetical protein